MGVGQFLRRADAAVQDTKSAVNTSVVLGLVALAVAAVALVVAVRRQ